MIIKPQDNVVVHLEKQEIDVIRSLLKIAPLAFREFKECRGHGPNALKIAKSLSIQFDLYYGDN